MNNLSDRDVKEKLVTRGAEALTDAELLSLLLASTAHDSAIDMAQRMLEQCGSLYAMSGYELTRLRMMEGIGIKSAALLSAAFELGRRVGASDISHIQAVKDKSDVVEIFSPLLSRLSHEEMWVLYLNSANRILEKRRISQGGVNSLVVDYKIVVKRAVELLSTSLIIVHNHPSGIASPSSEDIGITEKLSNAAALFDINLIDHIIIGAGGDYSFHQAGLIK